MQFKCRRNLSIAARMQLECSRNIPIGPRMSPDVIQNTAELHIQEYIKNFHSDVIPAHSASSVTRVFSMLQKLWHHFLQVHDDACPSRITMQLQIWFTHFCIVTHPCVMAMENACIYALERVNQHWVTSCVRGCMMLEFYCIGLLNLYLETLHDMTKTEDSGEEWRKRRKRRRKRRRRRRKKRKRRRRRRRIEGRKKQETKPQ